MIRFFSLLILSSCMFFACSSSQKLSADTVQKNQIRFGHGGGFTGAVTEYCITEKGEIYKKEMGDISKLTVDEKEVTQCFDKCAAIDFENINLNTPGNFYAYISQHQTNGVHRVDWNPHQPNLSPELVEFHNMLLALVGEEPMTITPTEDASIDGDKVVKKRVIKKLQPIKENDGSNTKKLEMKKLEMKKIKNKKLKKNKM